MKRIRATSEATLPAEVPVDLDRHRLSLTSQPGDEIHWLSSHGYRAALCPAMWASGRSGVVFQAAKGEPLELALIGETLVWNGERVIVE